MAVSDSLVNEIKGKNPIDKIKSNKRRIKAEIAALNMDTYDEEALLYAVEVMGLKADELEYSLDLTNEIIKEATARLRLKAIERHWKSNPDWQPIEKGDKLLAVADMVGAGYDDLSRYQIDTIYTVDKVVLLNYVGDDDDFPFHIDEEYFTRVYGELYDGHLAEYSRWMDMGVASNDDPYTDFRETLIDKGVMLFTVYKNQTGLGRVLSETLYLKRIA